MTNQEGTIYLLCFPPGLHVTGNRYASHYLGWTANGVESRVAYHLRGEGSRLIRAAVRAGLDPQVVRTWEKATRTFERRLKNTRNLPRLCPHCNPTGYGDATR